MEYIKEDVEVMLRNLPKNEARLIEVQLKKEEYQERLYYAGTVYEDTEEEIIENMQLAGQAYDSIHSNTNKISDKTASTALHYQKEKIHINREDRDYLQSKIIDLEAEEKTLNKMIARVKNLLSILSEKQKFVVEEFYINNGKTTWDKVEISYETITKYKRCSIKGYVRSIK